MEGNGGHTGGGVGTRSAKWQWSSCNDPRITGAVQSGILARQGPR